MKAMWNGSLSFGLINIPVRVYSASEERAIQFHMLHKKDLSPIRFARICKEDQQEVPYEDIVKGYEYEKGEYVVLDEEELKSADIKKTSTIEIEHFADIEEIPPLYFEKPYYLEPEKKAGKAYQLLNQALTESKKVAIAHFVFHNKEHIGAILPHGNILMLIQMRYHIEVRSSESLNIPDEKISKKELEMALGLIKQLTSQFKPEKHHDTYAEEIMALIENKLKGRKIKPKAKKKAPVYEIQDLMHLLQASMEQSKTKGAKPAKKKKSA